MLRVGVDTRCGEGVAHRSKTDGVSYSCWRLSRKEQNKSHVASFIQKPLSVSEDTLQTQNCILLLNLCFAQG